MEEQILRQELYECVSLLDLAHFNCCLGNVNNSKSQCLEIVKKLNRLSKTNVIKERFRSLLKDLSSYTLKFYDSIDSGNYFTYDHKIIWLSSKLYGELYPPLTVYSDKLDSFDSCLLPSLKMKRDKSDNLPLPESFSAHYEQVSLTNWTLDYNALSELYQDLLTNCSFVSSLLSIVELDGTRLLEKLISPREDVSLFKCQLYFNGCSRLVTVDNTLPFLNDSNRNLTINSISKKNLYWPALVEKAYLKVLGSGYKFEGSNMAIDTYMLINWIPEIVPINSSRIDCDVIWDYYLSKKVLLGIGTGKLSVELSGKLNLISGHDYLVVSFDQATHTIVLKNPWIENSNNYERTLSISDHDLLHFKYFYINWNPDAFFKYKSQTTFIYNVKDNSGTHIYQKPQFSLINSTKDSQNIWLLLEKHLPIKNISEQLINILIYETQCGDKVMVSNQYIRANKDSNTNSRLMLLKFTMQPQQAYTVVISSTIGHTFTLNMYNNISRGFSLNKAKFKYTTSIPMIEDKWTSANSGGNWSLSTYIDNPQYDIQIKELSTNMMIGLFSEFKDKFVNFHIFQSDPRDRGRHIRLFDKSKLLVNEKYSMSYQFEDLKNLQPGFYKIVVSTFDSNLKGDFKLLAIHDSPPSGIVISKIHASLGLFLQKSEVSWNNSNRFKLYFEATQFNSRFTFHITHYNHDNKNTESLSDYRPSIRGSIFDAENSQPIQINEEWNDSLYGLFIDCEIQKPNTYILLVERFELGSGRCKIDIGCNRKFNIL
ncbi:Calpain-like protease palB/RIM13 [Debaryomyces fabryi]|uniref:Cysteine protease RIM13 n=1 Tax=Debaryomyces fabryi TaxID=58627 RepID=A0A0V1PV72_9ASCO|nr:Calpain-like protease palB/RIM13 [Debaryomyces fabryi]KSA00157.1 Calpain-like protease palB/RIM13 [Debaryomyces fabryi]CUM54500.1 unnamed protein product [Debaryomyces fabryi]